MSGAEFELLQIEEAKAYAKYQAAEDVRKKGRRDLAAADSRTGSREVAAGGAQRHSIRG